MGGWKEGGKGVCGGGRIWCWLTHPRVDVEVEKTKVASCFQMDCSFDCRVEWPHAVICRVYLARFLPVLFFFPGILGFSRECQFYANASPFIGMFCSSVAAFSMIHHGVYLQIKARL
jgi:hypothetical protein